MKTILDKPGRVNMIWPALIAAVGSAYSESQKAGAASTAATFGGGTPVNDNSQINIAPVGVNLGEVLNPLMQGSKQNGGFGLTLPSRYVAGQQIQATSTPIAQAEGIDTNMLLLIGGGVIVLGGVAYFILR